MKDEFLADVSVELDPRSAHAIIALLPAARVVAVAAILVARREHMTMGRLVGALSLDTVDAVVHSIPDEADLLEVAFYIDDKATVGELASLLPAERVRKVVLCARGGGGGAVGRGARPDEPPGRRLAPAHR